MYLGCRVKIPRDGGNITVKTINGTPYVYIERGRSYSKEKKYSIPKRTCIGKRDPEQPDFMFPNEKFLKFFPRELLPSEKEGRSRSGCIHVGAFFVIRKIISDYKLDEMIARIIGRDAGLFLDLAAYAIVTENNAAQYYPDYAYNHPLFTSDMRVYSDSKISSFLRDISRDDSIRFQSEWNKGRDHREKIYISYDSTNKHCQAGDVEIAEYGHEKDRQNKPVFNYAVAYDRTNRLPLFYEAYPGSVNDVSQLQHMLDKAAAYGYRNAGFILDRGYFSESNIRFMDRNGFEFIMMVKGCRDLVSSLILEHKGEFEDEWENAVPYYDVNGMTVKGRLLKGDEKDRYFHIYYSDYRKARERAKLQLLIREQKEQLESLKGTAYEKTGGWRSPYFDLIYHTEKGSGKKTLQFIRERQDVISREIRLCGYFCIITSAEMTAETALDLYKSRDSSEKLFRGDKSYLGERSMRVYHDEPVHSKIFIEFVALIIRNKIYTCLKDRMKELHKKKNYMTVPAALKELDKIELIRQADGTYILDHAVTATQKDILQAFNLTAANVRKEAGELGKRLSVLTN